MKSSAMWLGLVAGVMAISCGGDDSTNIAVPDAGGGADTGGGGMDAGNQVDSGGNPDSGVPVDSSTPPDSAMTFNVGTVTGLVLWLDAGKGIKLGLAPDGGTAHIAKWTDQTSHGNDARGSGASQGRNPTQVMAGINGLPTVHFEAGTGQNATGNSLTISDNGDGSLQWGTGDFFIEVVARFDNDPMNGYGSGFGIFYSRVVYPGFGGGAVTGVELTGNVPPANYGNPATLGLYAATKSTAGDFVAATTAYNTGMAHRFAFQRTGVTLTTFVDGTSAGTSMSAGIDVSLPGTDALIGAVNFGGGGGGFARLDGDISEMIAVQGTISMTDQAGIEGYLKTKYGL